MENYHYTKKVFSLLLLTHDFSLEREQDISNEGKEAHYQSYNHSLIIGCSREEGVYIKIWLQSSWKTLHAQSYKDQSSFVEKIKAMEQDAERILLDS